MVVEYQNVVEDTEIEAIRIFLVHNNCNIIIEFVKLKKKPRSLNAYHRRFVD